MTVISALRPVVVGRFPGGWLWVRLMFLATRIPDRRRVPRTRGGRFRTLHAGLGKIGVIHAAHFALVRRFPDHGQPREDVHQCLLLFESNYDGGFDDYIEAFSACVPTWMKLFWGTSYGFPGPRPVTPFKDYIRANDFNADHLYLAQPDASTRMIRSALAFERRHAEFRKHAARFPASVFREHYDDLLAEV